MIDRNVQASLLAYKAYEIGRDATVRKKTDRAARPVSACISQLATKGETEETLRRRVFYTLIRAEILRTSDPVPDRTKAKETGERPKEKGFFDPYRQSGHFAGTLASEKSFGVAGNVRANRLLYRRSGVEEESNV